jgi:hypothetical protein
MTNDAELPPNDGEEPFFREAAGIPKGPQRDAFLEQVCANNPELRRQLEARLESQQQTVDLSEKRTVDAGGETAPISAGEPRLAASR